MTRARRARAAAPTVSAVAWKLLTDEPLPEPLTFERYFLEWFPEGGAGTVGPSLRAMWEEHRQAILTDWAAEHPGTRPSYWWRWDAPRWDREHRTSFAEPRHRVGGIGTPTYEAHPGHYPTFAAGIPTDWVGDSPTWAFGGPDVGEVPDPRNPPKFEAQAAYLARHGLFLLGERKRLQASDFEPETVDFDR